MPVIGPQYNKDKADDAYNEIMSLLMRKYDLLHFTLESNSIWVEGREKAKQALKDAVHSLFMQDSFEGW